MLTPSAKSNVSTAEPPTRLPKFMNVRGVALSALIVPPSFAVISHWLTMFCPVSVLFAVVALPMNVSKFVMLDVPVAVPAARLTLMAPAKPP